MWLHFLLFDGLLLFSYLFILIMFIFKIIFDNYQSYWVLYAREIILNFVIFVMDNNHLTLHNSTANPSSLNCSLNDNIYITYNVNMHSEVWVMSQSLALFSSCCTVKPIVLCNTITLCQPKDGDLTIENY